MRIGEVAAKAGVPAKTIRYWEGEGLLAAPARTSSGYREYRVEVIERLRFIRSAQAAGFTLRQIRTVLDVRDSGDAPCEHVSAMVASRLSEVEARLAELRAARRQLQGLARRAAELDPARCTGYCAILEA